MPPFGISGQSGGITIHGLEETIARLRKPTLLNRPIRKFWVAASVLVVRALQKEAPRSPNHRGPNRPLWASHLAEVDPGDPAGWMKIRNVAPHHRYVVNGTRAHLIRPRYRKALMWAGAAHPYAIVRHPGTKPNDYMKRAFQSVRARITNGTPSQELHRAVREEWEKSG